MDKVDFKKSLKHLYQPGKKDFEVVEVPEMQYLMVDGAGNPGTAEAYQDALAALYAVAYKIKFISKKELGRDYVVPPLQGLWWAKDMDAFVAGNKDDWLWTMMIMTPDWITHKVYAQALEIVAEGKEPLAALEILRLESYHEGLCAQIMHIGSYADEAPTLHRLHHDWMPAKGYAFNGKHHEIYLSDPRRVAPEKLKTILRQPVVKF